MSHMFIFLLNWNFTLFERILLGISFLFRVEREALVQVLRFGDFGRARSSKGNCCLAMENENERRFVGCEVMESD